MSLIVNVVRLASDQQRPTIRPEESRKVRAPFRSLLYHIRVRRIIESSAPLFRLIAAHIAELTRSFDEATLPLSALLNGCGLVAERVNRSSCQLRGLASASSFGGLRWRGGAIRPKSDAVTPPVTVQRLRRNAGVTAQPSAATPFQPVRSRQAIASLMNRPTASTMV